LTIQWTAASGAQSYNIVDPANGNSIVQGNIPATETETVIPGLTAGSQIHLAVVAINSAGSTQGGTALFTLPCPQGYTNQNGYCVQNQTVPPAPSAYSCGSPVSEGNGQYTVPICWNPVENFNVTEYLVHDLYYGNTFSVPAGATQANLTGVAAGTTISVQVIAVNSAGQSQPSNTVTVTTPSPQPADLSITDCAITYAQAGEFIEASVTVTNYGGSTGTSTLSGTMTNANDGSYAGHFNSVSISVPANSSQTFAVDSAGAAGSATAGVPFSVSFEISNGSQCVADFTMG
jgi:hypothetical protein